MDMTMDETVARINALYRKQKSVGLTESEKEEQRRLRQAYLAAIRRSLKAELDRIEWVDEPGGPSGMNRLH
jgi:uncharacterized protein YnzC (UPF0291/DUF896 family)